MLGAFELAACPGAANVARDDVRLPATAPAVALAVPLPIRTEDVGITESSDTTPVAPIPNAPTAYRFIAPPADSPNVPTEDSLDLSDTLSSLLCLIELHTVELLISIPFIPASTNESVKISLEYLCCVSLCTQHCTYSSYTSLHGTTISSCIAVLSTWNTYHQAWWVLWDLCSPPY